MFIPIKAHVHWNLLSHEQIVSIAPRVAAQPYSGLPANPSPEIVADALEANIDSQRDVPAPLAQEQGFLFLDLTPFFQRATESGSSLYFYGDTRWNAQGRDLARQTLLAFLKERGLLAQGISDN